VLRNRGHLVTPIIAVACVEPTTPDKRSNK
jgi:hypothetical protein